MDELERKVKSQQDQLFLTKQELTTTAAELKLRAVQAEGGHPQGLETGAPGGRVESGERAGGAGPRLPLLPERLELEKRRSRQSLEDAEQLRIKEVPPSWRSRASCSPHVRPGPAGASVQPDVPKAHPWLGSPHCPSRCQTQSLLTRA